MTLTKAEINHIVQVLDITKALLYGYPELFTDEEEDQLKIALEIMNEDMGI